MKGILRINDEVSFLGASHFILSVRIKDGTQTVCMVRGDGYHNASTITDVNHADFSLIPVTVERLKADGYFQDEKDIYVKEFTNGFALVSFRNVKDGNPEFSALLKGRQEPIAQRVRLKGVHHLSHLIDDLDLD